MINFSMKFMTSVSMTSQSLKYLCILTVLIVIEVHADMEDTFVKTVSVLPGKCPSVIRKCDFSQVTMIFS